MRKVVFVQRILPHYRIAFFRALREQLLIHGIETTLVYGEDRPASVRVISTLAESWAHRISNTYVGLGNTVAVWQPALKFTGGADLVIIEQANRLLLNYVLMVNRKIGKAKLAFWGHGRNFQAVSQGGFSESIKSRLATCVDWWFVYTEKSAEAVRATGFNPKRITDVNNAINDADLRAECARFEGRTKVDLAENVGLKGKSLGLFCGSLYENKRIAFLLQAGKKIRGRIPEFVLVVIGDGPLRYLIESAAKTCDWLHFIGPITGVARMRYFAASRVVLMPGVVGLVMVDSLIAGVPLVTTDIPGHGPEIAYLRSGVNGLVTSDSVDSYAGDVVRLLSDAALNERLVLGCRATSSKYTMENMVQRFAEGILKCLSDK